MWLWLGQRDLKIEIVYEARVNACSRYQIGRNILATEFIIGFWRYLLFIFRRCVILIISHEDYNKFIEKRAKLYNKTSKLVHANLSQYIVFRDANHTRIALFDLDYKSIDSKQVNSKEFLAGNIIDINNFLSSIVY